jgi:hypothetical protein
MTKEDREECLFDSVVKNAFSNFSDIHNYLLNERKTRRRRRRETRQRSSTIRLIRLPLTRTSRLSCPNELSSATSYNNIKKKTPRIINIFTVRKKRSNTLIIIYMTMMHTFDILLQLSFIS